MAKKYLVTDDELRAKVLAILRDVDTNSIGTIISFMGQQPPATYLRCDGGQYVIADYQELANFFAANFGAVNYFGGDGEQYFAMPDLRGEFLRGAGINSHANQGSGDRVGIHQDGTNHTSVYGWQNQTIGFNTANQSATSSNAVVSNVDKGIARVGGLAANATSFVSASAIDFSTFTSRPTNTSVLFCIKAKTW